MSGSATEPVLSTVRAPFRALGEVVLPGPDALDEEGWRRAESIVENALSRQPPRTRRQLRIFLRVLDLLPVLLTGRTLARLSRARRERFLKRLERSPFPLLRRGLWGVRTLLFMGYYNQDAVREAIGYRARREGWKALRGRGSHLQPEAGGGTGTEDGGGSRRRESDRDPEGSGKAGEADA